MKFNKHRHKGNKWITYGLINSLNSRDKKLQKLKILTLGSPEYEALKQNIACYNSILKRSIREAKKIYYHNTFEKYRNYAKNTWKEISELLCKSSRKSNPIKKLKVGDKIVTDKNEICNTFNDFLLILDLD